MTRRRWLQLAGGVAVGGGALLRRDEVRHRRLVGARERCSLGGLARPLTVAVLTDFHAPRFTFPLLHLHQALAREKPELVVILGDSIDSYGTEALVRALFGPIVAPLGKFAVFGNHERAPWIDPAALRGHYAAAGVRLLDNEVALVRHAGGELVIGGLGDGLRVPPRPECLVGESRTCLALVHCPAAAEQVAPVLGPHTLLLSGHTHGGQIAPFGHVLHTPHGSGRFVSGWYEVSGRPLYVSPGLGNLVVNARLGVFPTLVLLELS